MTALETDRTTIGDWEHAEDRGQLVRSWLEELAGDGGYVTLARVDIASRSALGNSLGAVLAWLGSADAVTEAG